MDSDFKRLGICDEIVEVIEKEGFKTPSRIQNKAIPQIFSGRDLIVCSKTGSGKTLIYATRLIQSIESGNGIRAIVLVPTRELAIQVGDVLKKFSSYKNLRIMITYGSSSLKKQRKEINDYDILVGTTGRISDYVEQDLFKLGKIKLLVIDEIDSIMQNQFRLELDYIIKEMPKKRQTMVFSATISKDTLKILKKYLSNPKRISLDEFVSPKKLKQYYFEVEANKKLSLLSYLLENERAGLSIVFVNRQDVSEFLSKNLRHTGLIIKSTHGGMSQGKRAKIIRDLENQKFDILIATDLTARGLDIDGITHIYNYNIPKHDEKYIHRIGRCARAGNSGKVYNFISKNDIIPFIDIMKNHKIIVQEKEIPEFKEVKVKKEYKKRKPRR